MSDLKGKTAIVIGVSQANIGRAIAQHFMELGADVIVAGRNEADVDRTGRELGVLTRRCDITLEEDLEDLTRFAIERYGHVDVAVNAVGANLVRPFLEVTRAELDAVVKTQFIGTFQFLQAMIRAMESSGGSIIQISSVTSQALLPDHAAYMASKAAGDMLVRSAAFDFGHRNIRVNSLSPGATLDAPMASEIMQDRTAREEICDMIPLGRIGTARDVADAAAWLAGDHCFMTGENLQINGGIAIPALSAPPSGKMRT
ncbi:SDR family oxidoreductase [Sphingobium sp. JS3065]|uniref:SDR family NAD(P)-dependent oxidoreductase n=1 Tax=Sphingobium sp. JS3065 TaxID=2970925 RepID=UPI002264447C|nr:SDR family oxidoreductase [Sphingobium sp. JS3065]UZW57464.1 SDR family oxidoreductase [Sphingobium sp. JS3065]